MMKYTSHIYRGNSFVVILTFVVVKIMYKQDIKSSIILYINYEIENKHPCVDITVLNS